MSFLMPVLTRTGATVVETEPVVDGRLRYQLLNGSGPSTGWVTVQVSCRTFVGQTARTPRDLELGTRKILSVLHGSNQNGRVDE